MKFWSRHALLLLGGIAVATSAASAQPVALEVSYGPEETVFASCKPALTLFNRGEIVFDYVQVDVLYRLRDGREVRAEHKSRYREGLPNPVRAGEQRVLSIHHDESVPLGAPCSDVLAARIVAAQCLAGGTGDPCTALAPAIGESLLLPPR